MFRTFIQCSAFLQAVMSAYFLIKAALRMSINSMMELSATRWDYSLPVLKNYTEQKANTVIGFSLLLLSVVLQILYWLLPFGIDDLGINRTGVIIAVVVVIPIGVVAHRLSCYLQQKWYTKAEDRLKKPKDEPNNKQGNR